MRRLFRCAGSFPESQLLNLHIPLDIVIDAEAPAGVLDDHHYLLCGVRKRSLRVGLGLPGWGGGQPNRRNVVSEWAAALAAVDPVLAPTAEDLLVGWLDPIGYYGVSRHTGTMQLTIEAASALKDVAAFPGLKLLLVGDTHHGLLTLANSLGHGLQEPWDALLLCHQAAHLDWFRSLLGPDRVFLYHLQICDEQLGLRRGCLRPASQRPRQALSFYGSFSHLHPRRSALLEQLPRLLGPEEFAPVARLPRAHWLDSLADDAATLCSCLNNQISTYHMYSLLAGSLVFTDRFHTASGWGRFFHDRDSVVLYESAEELVELSRHYRRQPAAADAIAARGRQLVQQHFHLDAGSHPWLLADSVQALREGLAAATRPLEPVDPQPLRWADPRQLVADLNVYQVLHELQQFFPQVLWLAGDDASPSLRRAVAEQLPRCLSAAMLSPLPPLPHTPLVLSRPPLQRELGLLARLEVPYGLLLLAPAQLQAAPDLQQQLAGDLAELPPLRLRWLGSSLARSDLAIQHRSPRSAEARWPLEQGWQAALIENPAAIERLPALYSRQPAAAGPDQPAGSPQVAAAAA